MTKKKLTNIIKNSYTKIDESILKLCDVYELHGISNNVIFEHLRFVLNELYFNGNRKPLAFLQDVQETFDVDRYNKYLKYRELNRTDSASLEYFCLKYGDTVGPIKFEEKKVLTKGSLERFIRVHGEEEGKNLYNEWCIKNKGNHSLERKIELYGKSEGIAKYEESQKRLKEKNTLNYYIEKFGESGEKMYYDRNKKNSMSSKGAPVGSELYDKIRIKQEELGNWLPLSKLSEFKIYEKEVWRITRRQKLATLKDFEKRGHQRDKDTYAVDHKISIKRGFEENIPADVIGDIANLQMLPHSENSSKKTQCYSVIEQHIK